MDNSWKPVLSMLAPAGQMFWYLQNFWMLTDQFTSSFSRFLWILNPFPNKPLFLRVCSTSLLKTLWEKEKLLVLRNFSFSDSVFYLFGEFSAIFIKFEIVVCKLSVRNSLKYVIRETVNSCKPAQSMLAPVGQMFLVSLKFLDADGSIYIIHW